MTQAQMRMPRHGFRPDGSKPYGPHGPMAPPPHMKVNSIFVLIEYFVCLSLFTSMYNVAKSSSQLI